MTKAELSEPHFAYVGAVVGGLCWRLKFHVDNHNQPQLQGVPLETFKISPLRRRCAQIASAQMDTCSKREAKTEFGQESLSAADQK